MIFFAPFISIIDVPVHMLIDDGNKKTKGCDKMNTLGKLEKMLLAGEITEEEYKYRKAVYVETILELYIK